MHPSPIMAEVPSLDMDVTVTHLVRDPVHDTEKPYELWMKTEPGVPKTNCQYEDKIVHVSDVRSSKEDFDVDRNGFKYVQHTSQCLPRFEDLSWESPPIEYLEETIKLVEKEMGADLVLLINWAVLISYEGVQCEY